MSDELYIDIFRYLADDAHDDRALEFAEVVWEHYYAAFQAGDRPSHTGSVPVR